MKNGHLSPDQLAQVATSGADNPPHVATCVACRDELSSVRRVVADLRSLPDPPVRLLEAAKGYFRTRRKLENLIERLMDDPALRTKASARPEAVLREAGLEPTPELMDALRGGEGVSRDLASRLAAKSFWG